jgi:hypothetical protein
MTNFGGVNVTTGSKHDITAANAAGNGDICLPCGCPPYLRNGHPNTLHLAGCKMNRAIGDRRSTVRQRPAVIAMFTQLNELWYLSHPRGLPSDAKNSDRR